MMKGLYRQSTRAVRLAPSLARVIKKSMSEMPIPMAPLTNISARSAGRIEKNFVVPRKTAVETHKTSATQFLNRFSPKGLTNAMDLLYKTTPMAWSSAVRRARSSPMGFKALAGNGTRRRQNHSRNKRVIVQLSSVLFV